MKRQAGRAHRLSHRAIVFWAVVAVIGVVLLVVGAYFIGQRIESGNRETVRGDLSERFANPNAIEYNGARYVPRKGIQTILFMGIDKDFEEEKGTGQYRNGGQADFLLLMILDSENNRVLQWQIDRDTVAEITTLGVLGNVSGTRQAQICLAYGFGDGREQSSGLTMDAVQRLLYGVPIDFYITIPFDAVNVLNDAVGGVTVTIEDDFSAQDAAMTPGTTLTLTGEQAVLFVRSRMSVGDGTNVSRMARQRSYMVSLLQKFDDMATQSTSAVGTIFDAMKETMITNMSRGRLINEVNKTAKYVREPLVVLEGEHSIGESGFVEFHIDEAALEQRVIDTFYSKQK